MTYRAVQIQIIIIIIIIDVVVVDSLKKKYTAYMTLVVLFLLQFSWKGCSGPCTVLRHVLKSL